MGWSAQFPFGMQSALLPAFVARPPQQPLGRYADPEELAEVIAFLCSEANTYMSGGIVPIKGGSR